MKHVIVEQDNELYESDEFFAYIKRGDSANMLGDVSMDDAYHIVCTVTRWLVEGLPDYRKQALDKLLQGICDGMYLGYGDMDERQQIDLRLMLMNKIIANQQNLHDRMLEAEIIKIGERII